MYPFGKSLYRMRQRHALYAFPVLPQCASMAGTQNHMGNNPLDLLAGCTRVVAGCHRKKHYNAPFLRQRTKSEAYEGVGKGSTCRSHCCRPFDPCLLCATGIPRRGWTGKHECLGATTTALAARGVGCALVRRLCATLFQKACVRQTKYCEFGSFLDCRRCGGSGDFVSPGNCQRNRWLASDGLERRKESICCRLLAWPSHSCLAGTFYGLTGHQTASLLSHI
jgi:hypothetical protein